MTDEEKLIKDLIDALMVELDEQLKGVKAYADEKAKEVKARAEKSSLD